MLQNLPKFLQRKFPFISLQWLTRNIDVSECLLHKAGYNISVMFYSSFTT